MTIAQPIPDLPIVRLPAEGRGDGAWTWLGSGLDAAILAAMQLVIDALLMPDPEDLPAVQASAESLRTPALEADPRRFFVFPEASLALTETRGERRLRFGAGRVTQRRLESGYRPFAPDDPPPGDDPIRLEHWQHAPERRRGSVIALHGFTMGYPRIDAPALFASQLFDAGLDVVLPTLPQHGARTPEDARFSGERFAVPHVAELAEAVRRAVHEVRALTLWLRETTGDPVGLVGLSLGGYLTALSAGLYDDLDFAIPIVPPVCIGDLAWRFHQRSRRRGDGGDAAFDYDELRRGYRLHSPLAHPLRLPRERVMIVAGRGDRIVPPEHPYALWRHWDQPRIHWFSGGHLAPFGRGAIVRAMLDHLRALGIV